MEFLNNYKPHSRNSRPEEENRDTPIEEYDVNFCFPVIALKSDKVELRPFLPKHNVDKLYQELKDDPVLSRYFDLEISRDAIYRTMEEVRRDPKQMRFAIYSWPIHAPSNPSPEQYEYAGLINFYGIDPDNLIAQFGVVVFREYRRTHVATHAVGLALRRLLQLPGDHPRYSRPDSGYGMRRVSWSANSLNEASKTMALRMGVAFEGILRNHDEMLEISDQTKETGGDLPRPGDGREGYRASHEWYGSITGHDWENGVRDIVERQMARSS